MLDTDFSLCGHRTCTQQWTCFLSVSDTEKRWTWSFTSWKSEKLLTVYHQESHSYTLFCHVISLWDYLGCSVVSIPSYCNWLHTHRASGNQRRKRPLAKVYIDFGDGCWFKGLLLKSSPLLWLCPLLGVFWILVSSGAQLMWLLCAISLCTWLAKNSVQTNVWRILYSLLETWQHIQFAKYELIMKFIGCSFVILTKKHWSFQKLVQVMIILSPFSSWDQKKDASSYIGVFLFLGADPIWWIDLQYP